MTTEFFQKEVLVAGHPVKLFSLDRWRWSSNQSEIVELDRRREKFFADMTKSIKRTTTFAPTRPRRREVVNGVAETK